MPQYVGSAAGAGSGLGESSEHRASLSAGGDPLQPADPEETRRGEEQRVRGGL